MTILARELRKDEFPLAEAVWEHYRQQKADPAADRHFVDAVGVARCRKHTYEPGSSRPGSSGGRVT